MKAMKVLGIILGVIVAIIIVLGLVQPTHFVYERSIDINAPKEVVFSHLNNFEKWEKWGPWAKQDSTIKITYGDKREGQGATYAWTSKNSGDGTMTITESTAAASVKTDIEFKGQGTAKGYFNLTDGEGGGTKTTWGMEMDVPFPFNAFTIFTAGMMEKNMNQMFDDGLANLKAIAETEPTSTPTFSVQTIDFPSKTYLGIRDKVKMSEMEAFYSKNLGAIMGVSGAKKLEMDGYPSGIYYDWNEETGTTDMAAAIPFKNAGAGAGGNIKLIEVPAGKALLIDYYGGYYGIGQAHYAMDDYMKQNNLTQKAPVIEEYITDPGTEPDSSKWLTKIYYFF